MRSSRKAFHIGTVSAFAVFRPQEFTFQISGTADRQRFLLVDDPTRGLS